MLLASSSDSESSASHWAVVHTPPGTRVELSVRLDEGKTLVVEVRDHGPGVPEGMETQVFGKFVRGSNSDFDVFGCALPQKQFEFIARKPDNIFIQLIAGNAKSF